MTLKSNGTCCERRAQHRLLDGALAVAHRDYDAGSNIEFLFGTLSRVEFRIEVGAYAFEMGRGDILHLGLICALARIDIVELAFAARSRIRGNACVQGLRNADNRGVDRQLQAKVVPASELEVLTYRTVAAQRRFGSAF